MLLDDLKSIHPTKFEHLVFDLLILSGLRNATWRTPGADAGRDIEGTALAVDLSGSLSSQRWYVECKRYEDTLDWPAVYGKIAYADNHGADYLLVCTTAALSPRCKEELHRRELTRPRLQVRYWDGPALENRVAREHWLRAKYGLTPAPPITDALAPLVTLAHKSIQTAYAESSLHGDALPSMEYAAALVELVEARATDGAAGHATRHPFVVDRDLYPWCSVVGTPDLSRFDGPGLRAILAGTRFYHRGTDVALAPSAAPVGDDGRVSTLSVCASGPALGEGHAVALPLIGIAADLEVALDGTTMQIRSREAT